MFELNGELFTLDQVQEAAQQSKRSVDDYIKHFGLTKREQESDTTTTTKTAKIGGTEKGATVPTQQAPASESKSGESSLASSTPKPSKQTTDYVNTISPRRGPFPHISGQPKGSTSSHLMSQIDNKAFPTLFQNKSGSWVNILDPSEALKEAEMRGEVFTFENEDAARKFAEGGWKSKDDSTKTEEKGIILTDENPSNKAPMVKYARKSGSKDNAKEDISIASLKPKPKDFIVYNGKPLSMVEFQALSQVQDMNPGDGYVIADSKGQQIYTYEEIKATADESKMSVKQYLSRLKGSPGYDVKVIPGAINVQRGMELNPVVVKGDITGEAAELAPDAKRIKKERDKLPENERQQFLEIQLRNYDDDQRKIISNLIKEPTEFKNATEASRYNDAKNENIEFIAKQISKQVASTDVQHFIETVNSSKTTLGNLQRQYNEAITPGEKNDIARQIKVESLNINDYVKENDYVREKIANINEMRGGLIDMVAEHTKKVSAFADNAVIEEALNKSYSLVDKTLLSIDEGFQGMVSAVTMIPRAIQENIAYKATVFGLEDNEIVKDAFNALEPITKVTRAEALYQGTRIAKAREKLVADLTFDQAKENGSMFRYVAEAASSNSFSTVASILLYSGPQGLVLGSLGFGLSSGGSKYTDLIYQRANAQDNIESLRESLSMTEDPEARAELEIQIQNQENISKYTDSDITQAATLSGVVEGGVTALSAKIGQAAAKKIFGSPYVGEFVNKYTRAGKVVQGFTAMTIGEPIEEHTIAAIDGMIIDGLYLGNDVNIDDIINLDTTLKILISTGGTAMVGSSARVAGGFTNMVKSQRQQYKYGQDIKRLTAIKNEIEAGDIDGPIDDLLAEAGTILSGISQDNEQAAINLISMSDADIKNVFKLRVKQRKLLNEAGDLYRQVRGEDGKIADPIANKRLKDLKTKHEKIGNEIDGYVNFGEQQLELNPEQKYTLDWYNDNVKIANAKSTVLRFGETQAERDISIKLNKKVKNEEEITIDDAIEYVMALSENNDFRSLPVEVQMEMLDEIQRNPNLVKRLGGSFGINNPFTKDIQVNILNTGVVRTAITNDAFPSDIARWNATVSPNHELLHNFTSNKADFSDVEMEEAGMELRDELKRKVENGEISRDDFDYAIGRTAKYIGALKKEAKAKAEAEGKSKEEIESATYNKAELYEEVMNLYHDLYSMGVLKDADLDNKFQLKKALKQVYNKYAGLVGGRMFSGVDNASAIKQHLISFREFQAKVGLGLGDIHKETRKLISSELEKELLSEGMVAKTSLDDSDLGSGFEISEKYEVSDDAYERLDNKWNAGEISDEEYYSRLEMLDDIDGTDLSTEALSDDFKPLPAPKIKQEDTPTDKKIKKKVKRKLKEGSQSEEFLKGREEMQKAAVELQGTDQQLAFHPDVVRNVKKLVEVAARTWRKKDGNVVNFERVLKINNQSFDDFKSDVHLLMVKDINKYDTNFFKDNSLNTLAGYINGRLKYRMAEVMKRYITEETTSLKAGRALEIATEDKYTAFDAPDIKAIEPGKILTDEQNTSITNKVEELLETSDVNSLRFKNIRNIGAAEMGEHFGMVVDPIAKVHDPKRNLSWGEMKSAQMNIVKNWQHYMKMLPKGAVDETASENLLAAGKRGLRLPNNILKAFYTKSDERVGTAGLKLYSKRNNITKEEFFETFAIDADGAPMKGKTELVGPRSPHGQAVKGWMDTFGRLVTNRAVRQVLENRGFNMNVINDIASGKSDRMMSISENEDITEVMREKTEAILANDEKLFEIVSKALKKKGYSRSAIARAVKEARVALNDGKNMFVNKTDEESVTDYLNNREVFETISGSMQYREITGTLGQNLAMQVKNTDGSISDTPLASAMKSKILPNIVKTLTEEVGMSPTQAVITLTRFMHGSLVNSSDKALFKNNGEAVKYLNKVFENYIKDNGSFHAYKYKSGKYEDDPTGSIFFRDVNEGVKKVSNVRRNTAGTMKSYGLEQLINEKDFSKILAQNQLQAILAKQDLKNIVSAMNLMDLDMNGTEVAGFISMLMENPHSTIRMAFDPQAAIIKEGVDVNDYIYDTRPPASYVARLMAAYLMDNKSVPIQYINDTIDSMIGVWIPKEVHDQIRKVSENTTTRPYKPHDVNELDSYNEILDNDESLELIYSPEYDPSNRITEAQNDKYITRRKTKIRNVNPDDVKTKAEKEMSEVLAKYDTRLDAEMIIDEAAAKNLAVHRKKRPHIIRASAQDFEGMLYSFLGKGTLGESQYAFFEEKLLRPFNQAELNLNKDRHSMRKRYKVIVRNNKEAYKMLGNEIPTTDPSKIGFTYDHAVRVYLYNKASELPKGLSDENLNFLLGVIKKHPELRKLANDMIQVMPPQAKPWIKPEGAYWTAQTLKGDVIRGIETISRAYHLQEWKNNKDQIFSRNNMNMIEAAFGKDFKRDLSNILKRMEMGRSISTSGDKTIDLMMDWFRASVSTTMFWNMRSAMLQTISTANYINLTDNNPLQAAKLIGTKEYYDTVIDIFKSAYLQERRGGMKTEQEFTELSREVSAIELDYSEILNVKDPVQMARGFIHILLKNGFTPTKYGDSIAISVGGATLLINRKKSYMKQGMSEKEAYKKAYEDFQEQTEKAQQSTRQDKLSNQQTTMVGRVFLAFQNTPMQYTRIIEKATKDLINGRGNAKQHLAKIGYYGIIQQMMFSALQNWTTFIIDDDEEDELMVVQSKLDAGGLSADQRYKLQKRKSELKASYFKRDRAINNWVDSYLRGTGIAGAFVATTKNIYFTYEKESDKGWKSNVPAAVKQAMLETSPAIGIKFRKLDYMFNDYKYNKDVIKELELDARLNNPAFDIWGNALEFSANIPAHRVLNKYRNLFDAVSADLTYGQKILLAAGWSPYSVGYEDTTVEDKRREIAADKKEAKKKSTGRQKSRQGTREKTRKKTRQ